MARFGGSPLYLMKLAGLASLHVQVSGYGGSLLPQFPFAARATSNVENVTAKRNASLARDTCKTVGLTAVQILQFTSRKNRKSLFITITTKIDFAGLRLCTGTALICTLDAHSTITIGPHSH